jgi:hypothetical protein
MSDLGKLFRLSVAGLKPLENFTTAALAIAIDHDHRPIMLALRKVDRTGHEGSPFAALDAFATSTINGTSVRADTQKTLWPVEGSRLGYLDLVLSAKDAQERESVIWIEVMVDAWESADQIDVYLGHAGRLIPRPDVITLGRTKITDLVPFLRWSDVVDAIESVSNPHYTWVSLREFLVEEKIVRPKINSVPADAAACIDVIIAVNGRIRELWEGSGTSLAWADGNLRNSLAKVAEQELLAMGGPLVYGLARFDGLWQWCVRVTVAKNYERIRLDARQVLQDAESGKLPQDWIRQPDQPEVLERRLAPGSLNAHDDIVQWFDDGLRQLRDAGVVRSYLAGLAEKKAAAAVKSKPAAAAAAAGDAES